jgi:actin-like ATPase involved in cell morphogenesis
VHFIVGIDLGTTNCAVSFVEKGDLAREPLHIQTFDIPQLTRPGAVESRPLLPSFLYQAAPSELPEGSTVLPWDKKNKMIVGELARSLGAKVPGRLVASAKSWLCSPSVDRTAAILPWGAPEDVKRVSPVEASAFYLDHIREAWDHVMAKGHPERKLAEQDIVITVPASFDEAARELTVQAAKAAGLETITLLEEPQAAFYAWMAAHAKSLDKHLKEISRVLVCDVGGGTTDFSLIEVHRTGEKKSPLELRRSAVGDHLMLGGDNMDLALSRFLEKKINGVIDAHQFKALTAAAREGKERIYSDGAPAKVPITVMGRGSSVIGGSVKTELLQSDAGAVLLDGFFPVSRLEDNPVTTGRAGIREWGLPYVNDPAVTRHLSQFLRHHAKPPDSTLATIEQRTPKPDAILFNGGAMKPAAFRERVLSVVKNWFGGADVEELGGTSLDLAVAQGAAYYGCVRRGRGVRIGGGMGRGYYIGIETDPSPQNPSGKAAICLVPQGTEEGDEIELPQSFILRLATPVVFPLFSSSVRAADKLGAIIDEESKDLAPLPPLETMLHGGRRATKKDVSVRLHASLTEVGTLGLSLKSVSDDRSWEIHLNVRSKVAAKSSTEAEAPKDASGGVDPRKIDAALALVNRAFDPQSRDPIPPGILTKQMEAALALSKEAWPASLARRLADAVLGHADQRARSPEHEARWLNLVGYLLRPGFGDIADVERMRKLYNATRNALNFVSDPNARIEWWVLWRRVSGGLKEDQERELFYRLQPFLTNDRDVSKRGGWPRPTKGEVPEMWRAAASLELLDLAQKKMLGQLVLDQMEDEGPSTAMFWTLARLGARQPAHASPHNAVPPDVAEAWLKALLALDWAGNPMAVFAAVNLARKTGDRTRDVGEAARLRIMDRLKKAGAGEHDIAAVKSVTELENTDRKMIFGDALPPALKMEAQ